MASTDLDAGAPAGEGIIRASWIGTLAMALTAIPAAIAPHTFVLFSFVVSMALFVAGVFVFFWAYAVAVNRSRQDLIGIGGLFFLAGTAPRPVQLRLLGSLAVEVVVAFATAGARPFTPLAFGVLAPLYALSLCGLWAAKYGSFAPRPPEAKPKAKTQAKRTSSSTKAKGAGSTKGRSAKRR